LSTRSSVKSPDGPKADWAEEKFGVEPESGAMRSKRS
jgi:hypothetical protein